MSEQYPRKIRALDALLGIGLITLGIWIFFDPSLVLITVFVGITIGAVFIGLSSVGQDILHKPRVRSSGNRLKFYVGFYGPIAFFALTLTIVPAFGLLCLRILTILTFTYLGVFNLTRGVTGKLR
jgi:hypothetical protein